MSGLCGLEPSHAAVAMKAFMAMEEAAAPLKGPCAPPPEPAFASSQPSSIDTCAQLPPGAASPTKPLGPATSSQRSAGTVSGGGGEVAQAASAAPSLAPSLKRALSSCGEDDGADSAASKVPRLEGTPGWRAAAARAATACPADSGDEGGADSSGLDFLLKACEMLDPLAALQEGPSRAASVLSPACHPLASAAASADVHGTPKITRQSRHGVASLEASPAALPRRPASRRLLAREASAAAEPDWSHASAYASDDADADYLPTGRPSGRGAASSRAARASARSSAAAAAAPPADRAESSAGGGGGAAAGGGGGRGRWGDQPKQMITGPCMNPECEHPLESPQWRKGPPQYPVLCNACGTRWLRNGTLKPLVPRRGLRYKNKQKPVKGKAAAAAQAAAQAAAAAAVAPLAALPPPCPSPLQPQRPASSQSDVSEGGAAAEPLVMCGAQGSVTLPPVAPLQASLPSVPFVPAVAFNPALAFGPAVFGSLDPAAAAAAAAEAFKAATQVFAAPAPWGFFAPQPQAVPALFQPAPAAQPQQQQHEAPAEQQPEAPAAGEAQAQPAAVEAA